jgi:hypothetical protein
MPAAAEAYVGPGAGLSLFAAFWAALVGIGTILMFLVIWPVRRLLRQREAAKQGERPETTGAGTDGAPHA